MRTALVTGGAGFLGLYLARELKERGWAVRLLDVLPPPADEETPGEFIRGDVNDAGAMAAACTGVEVLFHAAALVPLLRAGFAFERVNVQGTRSALVAARRAGTRKAVVVSSSAVFGVPASSPLDESSPLAPREPFGRSKAGAESVCAEMRRAGMDVAIVRPRTLIGPGRLGILQLLFDWVSLGKRIYLLGSGKNRYQLLSARDCARACALAAEKPCRNEDFNVGAERYGSLREDIDSLCRHAGTGARTVPLPAVPAKAALRAMDALRLSPLVSMHYESLDADWRFDVSKAKRVLGWSARDSNAEMLAEAYDWFVADKPRRMRAAPGASAHRGPVTEGLLGWIKRIS